MLSSPMLYTIIAFTVIMIAIYRTKPQVLFDGDKLKEFGVGENKAMLPFPVVAIFIAIVIYFIFFYIDHINSKSTTSVGKNIILSQADLTNSLNQLNSNMTPTQPFMYRIVKQTADGQLLI